MNNSKACHRRSFTLVELLVVIVILTILAALIIPAVMFAITKAKNARIATEINSIAMALERYKTEMGEYPPDFSVDPIDIVENRQKTADEILIEKQNAITAHLSRAYRYRVAQNMATWTDPGTSPANITDMLSEAEILALNPRTALHFWLRGFTSSKTHPVRGEPPKANLPTNAADRSSYFDFNDKQIRFIPNNNTPLNSWGVATVAEYYPSQDRQMTPYIYYRASPDGTLSSAGVAYITATRWANSESNASKIPAPYYVNRTVPAPTPNPYAISDPAPAYANATTYQMISAGLDGGYGSGGTVFPNGPFLDRAELDNITNFSDGGTFEDAQP